MHRGSVGQLPPSSLPGCIGYSRLHRMCCASYTSTCVYMHYTRLGIYIRQLSSPLQTRLASSNRTRRLCIYVYMVHRRNVDVEPRSLFIYTSRSSSSSIRLRACIIPGQRRGMRIEAARISPAAASKRARRAMRAYLGD